MTVENLNIYAAHNYMYDKRKRGYFSVHDVSTIRIHHSSDPAIDLPDWYKEDTSEYTIPKDIPYTIDIGFKNGSHWYYGYYASLSQIEVAISVLSKIIFGGDELT